MTHELWSTLNRKMVDFLDSVSLQDLVDQQRLRQIQEASKSSGAGVRVNVVGTTGSSLSTEPASISL